MRPSKSLNVKLDFSDHGCALFAPEPGAKLTLEVHSTDNPDDIKEVKLRGDRDGLCALAAAILATSECRVFDYHMHIGEDVNGPVFRSPDGFTLTIERMGA